MMDYQTALTNVLHEQEVAYVTANPKSQESYKAAKAHLPGGNTRSVLFYTPFPVVIERAEGAMLWDIDGHRYTDFLGEYTAGVYGHSHPTIMAAISQALADGIVLGGPNRYEAQLAELICNRFPSCELVRFCNSGTEAHLMAISAARATTGRDTIMAFNGGYHGGLLNYAPGAMLMNAPYETILADYNDLESSLDMIEANADQLAAVILEPMQGAGGGIPARLDFLQALREATTRHDIVLIFDEVMTSRLSAGGLQKQVGITPDLTALGKYVGGGLSFGAFGGRREIMNHFDPLHTETYSHSGTFNNNVLTMAAGVAGLSQVYTAAVAEQLNQAGDTLRDRLHEIASRHEVPLQATGVGSILTLHFQQAPIEAVTDMVTPADLRALYHLFMLSRGIYFGRRG
ncbi:MAG: aminotransferase class III-fold pyridoxal phosphate-dependent enzyme, partial [Chloroflexota bacterium]